MDAGIKTGRVVNGWNISIMQLFGSGPKLTIVCGHCGKVFEKRVSPSHRPLVGCTLCHKLNQLDITIEE